MPFVPSPLGPSLPPMRVYIDGENLFIRAEQWVKDNINKEYSLQNYIDFYTHAYKDHEKLENYILTEPPPIKSECNFFWDFSESLSKMGRNPKINIYFTSFSGDDDNLHSCRVFIRNNNFEPYIIKENKQLAQRRNNTLKEDKIIDKAKGVDIALAVRMIEDAYLNVYDECALFSSDIDYLPVIQSVQRMGKLVHVFSFRNGIGNNSPLEYVPHKFYDLSVDMVVRQGILNKCGLI